MLAIIETHPVQYHAPLYRMLQQQFQVPVTVIYGSDFSVNGYRDREFGANFAWDTDLLSGYKPHFLSRASNGGATNDRDVSAKELGIALREVDPKAVLLVGYSPRFYQRAVYEAWRLGRPILFRGETTDHAQRRGAIKAWTRDFLLRRLYSRCAKLLYVGQRSRRHFERLRCPTAKLAFSPYCVETAAFRCNEKDRVELREKTRSGMGVSESDFVILFSGKMSFRKGPDIALAAARALPETLRRKTVLLFLGDGELRVQLADEAKREPQVRTLFVGFKNQKELSPFYHCAELLVLPSRYGETWGLVVNDALHHGLPCLVSGEAGCGPDLIEPGVTGGIFDISSIDGLADELQRMAQLTGRAEIRAACRAKAAGYSLEKAAEGLAAAYREVACC